MSFDTEAANIARELLSAARAAGMRLSGDGRVATSDAAALLGVDSRTLERWRAAGQGPDLHRLGGGAVTYSLLSLAHYIVRAKVTAAEHALDLARPTNADIPTSRDGRSPGRMAR